MLSSESENTSQSKSRKKHVCFKVEDPNYGRRKTPENLKKIHKKLAMLGILEQDQQNPEIENLTNANFQMSYELNGLTAINQEAESESETKQKADFQQPCTTSNLEEQETQNGDSKTAWITKDEFIGRLFKSL